MNKGRQRMLLLWVLAIAVVIILSIVHATKLDARDTSESTVKEIKIVTITPKEEESKEYVDFDLRHLSIIRKDGEDDGLRIPDTDDQSDLQTDGYPGDDEEGTDGDETGDTGSEVAAEPEDGGDTGSAGDDESVSELVEPESVSDESGSEGSVDEYSGDAEDGYSDGYSDESEVEEVIAESEPEYTYLGTWTATAYCSCPICCGQYSSGYTASGTYATEGRTVACNVLPFGTQVMIDGNIYTVEDTGWNPYGDAWIDIFFSSHDAALAYGCRQVDVYLVN